MKSQRHRYIHKTSSLAILAPVIPFLVWSVLGQTDTGSPGLVAGPAVFDLIRNTIDGGGQMRSKDGDFVLSGTIGQPDAGVMQGGDFTLSGGFWFGLPPTDCNDDGLVSLFDHETFTSCLLGPSGGIGASPCPCFDVDGDGDITLRDYAQLQVGFTGQ